jgi:hypothetical protein
MRQISMLVAGLIALTGCANPIQTTSQTGAKLAAQFVGRPVQDFVTRYGFPSAAMPAQEGATMYEWRSDVLVHKMPSTTTVSTYVSGNTATSYATTSGGSSTAMFCVVSLRVQADGRISAIGISRDTVGGFAISRCAEVLGM